MANKTAARKQVLERENINRPSEQKLCPSPSKSDTKNKNVTETTP